MKINLKLMFFVSAAIVLSGCASPARVDQMTISANEANKYSKSTPLKNNVLVTKVSGGKKTNPLWTSEIGTDEFMQALIDSLEAAKLLTRDTNAKYYLNARMIRVDQPLIGASLTVTSVVQYTLMRASDGKILFNEEISTPYTAKFSDSLIAIERLKLANEGSARNNITRLIDKLYILKL